MKALPATQSDFIATPTIPSVHCIKYAVVLNKLAELSLLKYMVDDAHFIPVLAHTSCILYAQVLEVDIVKTVESIILYIPKLCPLDLPVLAHTTVLACIPYPLIQLSGRRCHLEVDWTSMPPSCPMPVHFTQELPSLQTPSPSLEDVLGEYTA